MGNPVHTKLPAEQAEGLTELALDLRWSWNHAGDDLWRQLDPELWETTRNPWLMLQAVSHARLRSANSDPRFRERIEALLDRKRQLTQSDAWFQKTHPGSALRTIAYFSMEYMLSEALPIYSGGLGNVAGDQLKSASDLGLPVIGVGLLYQQGYFRQEIDSHGAQVALYPFNDPCQLPIRPLRDRNGDWLRMKIALPACTLWIRAWHAQVGRLQLYLLDTNDPANSPSHRTITGELYGGGPELRLRQELVLGIGGWRLLRALGVQPEVCHLNEGHSAFAVLERARAFMEDYRQPFRVALLATRAGNLFTTHTAVDAGFDRFSPDLMEEYLSRYAEERLAISFRDLLALGRRNPGNGAEAFTMAYLALRGSGAVNGVSRLHSSLSRRLFRDLFSRWPETEVPIGHVTNGIHVPTWDSPAADALWEDACGQERWRGSLEYVEEQIRCVEDQKFIDLRSKSRKALIAFIRNAVGRQRAHQRQSPEEIDKASRLFSDDRLTMGFARRFATYKRPNLLLYDPERLIRILTNSERPVQLVLAGKAHPQDTEGLAMIKQWNDFVRRPEIQEHAVFLADYDMLMTQELVGGVDLWINTPRRPWEACGTSGMKILANGGLNLSELDGWWAEAYAPDVGWAIGDGKEHGEDGGWDRIEAAALYEQLETDIIPAFYDRGLNGIPRRWTARMRESMARLTPTFSANRMLRQYTEQFYLSLASNYCTRAAHSGRESAKLLAWMDGISARWGELHFGNLVVNQLDGLFSFRIDVHLGTLKPDNVRVEIYADPVNGKELFRAPLSLVSTLSETDYMYSGTAPADRPASHYTPRIIPDGRAVSVPLELPLITWQK